MSHLGGGNERMNSGGLGMRVIKPAFSPRTGEVIAYVVTGVFTAIMATLMVVPFI